MHMCVASFVRRGRTHSPVFGVHGPGSLSLRLQDGDTDITDIGDSKAYYVIKG